MRGTTPTLQQARDHYVDWLSDTRDLSSHTVRAYRSDVTALLRTLDRHASVEVLAPTTIRRFFEQQRVDGLRSSTLRRRAAGIQSFCQYLDREHLVPSTPWPSTGFTFQRTRSLPRALPGDDLTRLLEHLIAQADVGDDVRGDRPLARATAATTLLAASVMLTTGLRVGELVSIRTSDLDLSNHTIHVLGKGRRERVVYLTDDWLTRLARAYLATRDHLGIQHGHLLFNALRAPLSAASVRARLLHAGRHAGLRQRVTPHMLRHSAATQLIESGVNIRFVQRLLGHASLTTTEIYTHVTDQALHRAIADAAVLSRSRHRR